ncbi:hypothetical protein D9613_000107 [Agrocybe pediades]|uniref:Protein kinase domain-containing protein n=1 Tax=Agrocybe pediades TaxID=84607 RepID=A0A8H4R2H1_9AGAR|nr:hypothetical protein D9613_000107 [Agrocybe pediades]
MQDTTLTINFAYEAGQQGDVDERDAFWYSPSTTEWFERRGYILYKPVGDDYPMRMMIPKLACLEEIYEGQYPFAAYDSTPARYLSDMPLRAWEFNGKVMFAQDRQGRHVAIKLVRLETEEYRILEFLRDLPLDTLEENCVLPVLDILPIEGFCFVVMPRWGVDINRPTPSTVGQVLQMMRDMLKGLAFLHSHNIIHGDIKISNFLMDDFRDDYDAQKYDFRYLRRAEGRSRYAIYDFDMSRKVPKEINRRDYWISTDSGYAWGTFNVTMDYAQGELEYNPFITDVGCLGVLFSDYFQDVVPALPVLAPLIDMLTTHKLRQRFTAAEALAFLEDHRGSLSEEELNKPTPEHDDESDELAYHKHDRWASVPPHLAKQWADYREPPVSWKTKLLRRLFEYEWIYVSKAFLVRKFLARIPRVWENFISHFLPFLVEAAK